MILLTAAATYSFALHQLKGFSQTEKAALEKVGDECVGIAENSVANMAAIVEFQKLEIEGRKFNVIRRCMADHGYFESPQWSAFAKPLALSDSLNQHISEDEAMENLRRRHMVRLKPNDLEPIYWALRH